MTHHAGRAEVGRLARRSVASVIVAALAVSSCTERAAPGEPVGDQPTVAQPSPGSLVPESNGPAAQTSTSREDGATTPEPNTGATGVVSDAAGAPIAGALIEPAPLEGQHFDESEFLRTTDARGRYQLALPPGRWELSVSADGYKPSAVRIEVPSLWVVETNVSLQAD